MRRSLIFLSLAFIGLFHGFAEAQWQVQISTTTNYYDNLLRTYSPVRDYGFIPGADIAYTGKQVEVYYSSSFFGLVENRQYNYQYHEIGGNYFFTHRQTLNGVLGADYSIRKDRQDFDYYDFSQIHAYSDLKWYPLNWMMITGGLSAQYKMFPKVEEWDHVESWLYLTQSLFLKTRTTLRWGLDIRHRNFLPYMVAVESESNETSGNGWGRQLSNRYVQEELSSLWQWQLQLRIAQSLGRKLGGYTEFRHLNTPSGGNPYELEIDSFSPIDDYFGYSGNSWNTSLKYKISPAFWINGRFTLFSQEYLNRPVYLFDKETGSFLMDGEDYIILEPRREDSGTVLDITLGLDIARIFDRASNLGCSTTLTLRDNRSNDAYFSYKDSAFTFAVTYDFQW